MDRRGIEYRINGGRFIPSKARQKGSVLQELRRLSGYAATFGTEARIGGGRERIAPGAFRASLSDDILALVDHDASKVLGRTSSGSLRLEEDDVGLRYELDLPDTALGRDLLTLADRGDLGGMSFGFLAQRESQDQGVRVLEKVKLIEVSFVHAFPAYQGTTIEPRAARPRLAAAQRYMETI